jgi:hypothetical protein
VTVIYRENKPGLGFSVQELVVLVCVCPPVQNGEMGEPRPILGHVLVGKRFSVVRYVADMQRGVPSPRDKGSAAMQVLHFAFGVNQGLIDSYQRWPSGPCPQSRSKVTYNVVVYCLPAGVPTFHDVDLTIVAAQSYRARCRAPFPNIRLGVNRCSTADKCFLNSSRPVYGAVIAQVSIGHPTLPPQSPLTIYPANL